MSEAYIHKRMIRNVATALGDEFLDQVAFVGGCTTSLLITDDFSLEQVRHTNDVDLILHVVGYAQWSRIQAQLRTKGFKDIMQEAAPICAMRLGELRVDFMPDDERLLGFSNRWYEDALQAAELYRIDDDIQIRLVTPPYFVATKLEAYKGRGNNDPLASQDIEDILNLFNGRPSLIAELSNASEELRTYVAAELRALFKHPSMAHAIESCCLGDAGREQYLSELLDAAIALGT